MASSESRDVSQIKPSILDLLIQVNRSRATSAGLDPHQYDAVTAKIGAPEQWLDAFIAAGEEHLEEANRAEDLGQVVSATDAFSNASLWFHYAACVPHPDRAAYVAAEKRAASALRRRLAHADPAAEYIDGRQVENPFVGLLQRPAGVNRPPVVIIIAGLDSCKEEFQAVASELLRRGVATFSIDGPGQGEIAENTFLSSEYEKVAHVAIDHLREHDNIDPDRIGAIGLSLGGYYVARAAAFEPRLRAAVAVTGPYSMTDWASYPSLVHQVLTLRAGDVENAKRVSKHIDLTGITSEIAQPLLVIGGDRDPVVPVADAERLAKEVRNSCFLRIPEGDHLCANTIWKWRPYAADWLVDQLTQGR